MEVHHLLVARHAERATDGSYNFLGAGFDYIWADSLPYLTLLNVAAKVSFDRADSQIAHEFGVKLVDPDGEGMLEAGPIPVPQHEIPPERDCFNIQFNIVFNGLVFFTALCQF